MLLPSTIIGKIPAEKACFLQLQVTVALFPIMPVEKWGGSDILQNFWSISLISFI